MTKYRFTSAALLELREAALYYERKEGGLGSVFLDEIDATLERTTFPACVASHVSPNQTLPNSPLPIWAPLPN
jgi:hypothetical protein